MADLALFFLLHGPAEAVVLFIQIIIFPIFQTVEEIKVKILHSAFFQLLPEDPIPVLWSIHDPGRQFGGQIKTLSRIAVHQRLFDHPLGIAAVIHVGRVKIVKSALHISVHHALYPIHVHRSVILGQAHQPKSQLRHLFCLNPLTHHIQTSSVSSSNLRITFAGTPATTQLSGTSFVTTAPAATTTLFPMVTPGRMVQFPPIHTSRPITTGFA